MSSQSQDALSPAALLPGSAAPLVAGGGAGGLLPGPRTGALPTVRDVSIAGAVAAGMPGPMGVPGTQHAWPPLPSASSPAGVRVRIAEWPLPGGGTLRQFVVPTGADGLLITGVLRGPEGRPGAEPPSTPLAGSVEPAIPDVLDAGFRLPVGARPLLHHTTARPDPGCFPPRTFADRRTTLSAEPHRPASVTLSARAGDLPLLRLSRDAGLVLAVSHLGAWRADVTLEHVPAATGESGTARSEAGSPAATSGPWMRLRVRVGTADGALRLPAGASLALPAVLVAFADADEAACAERLRRLLRSLFPTGADTDGKTTTRRSTAPVWCAGATLGAGVSAAEIGRRAAALQGAGIGGVMLDAGWAEGSRDRDAGRTAGCFGADPARFPEGLAGLARQLAGAGTALGVAVDVQRVHSQSALAGRLGEGLLLPSGAVRGRWVGPLVPDFGRRAVRRAMWAELDALVRTGGLGWLRLDAGAGVPDFAEVEPGPPADDGAGLAADVRSPDPATGGASAGGLSAGDATGAGPDGDDDGNEGSPEGTTALGTGGADLAWAAGLGRVVAGLRRRHPGLRIEIGTTGGTRFDAGLATVADVFRAADGGTAPDELRAMVFAAAEWWPPERLTACLPVGHADPATTDRGPAAAAALAACAALPVGQWSVDADPASPATVAALKRAAGAGKLLSGALAGESRRLLPVPGLPGERDLRQFHDAATDAGFLAGTPAPTVAGAPASTASGATSTPAPPASATRTAPAPWFGVRAERTYRIRDLAGKAEHYRTGAMLRTVGLVAAASPAEPELPCEGALFVYSPVQEGGTPPRA